MGNRVQGAGNGEQGTGNESRRNWEQPRELEMKMLIGLPFQPRSQDSLLPVPTDSRRVGERT